MSSLSLNVPSISAQYLQRICRPTSRQTVRTMLLFSSLCSYFLIPHIFTRYSSDNRKAYSQLWSLSKQPSGNSHHFLTTPSGFQLHYLLSPPSASSSSTLVIFLHGFPDSCQLFSSTLCSTLGRSTTLVALDLPGYGGSDSLDYCGANDVLNAISEAIVALKDKHLPPSEQEGGQTRKCVLVGHDWGGVVRQLSSRSLQLFL